MSTPALQLRTLFVFNNAGRMLCAREPGSPRPPRFYLTRSQNDCAWAVSDDVSDEVAEHIGALVATEPSGDFSEEPKHSQRYIELLGGSVGFWGAAYGYPPSIEAPDDVAVIDDPAMLTGELADLGPEIEGRSPVLAVMEDDKAVSICFCARLSDDAAEAGLNTMKAYRGRGYGSRVAAAWGKAIRESGRVPLYSVLWTNAASLTVARKLNLRLYASNWSVNP